MKIIFRRPLPDPQRKAELLKRQWIRLKEPDSIGRALVWSMPLMLAAGGLTLLIIDMFAEVSIKEYGADEGRTSLVVTPLAIASALSLLLIHEAIHLVLIPKFWRSEKTWIGLRLFGGFVLTEEEMSRRRYIVISAAPYILISIILPLILGWLGWLAPGVIILLVLNALGSSLDLLNIILILIQTPPKARLVCTGTATFWKAPQGR
ncbi:DUF3267 domain-containing protein [Paenibacillus pinihumi]|uniref:DUF3267 domain-containing protein n=1 Tax=Paenibacillus pinihumi TaxID=669462 RepID=UPI000417CB4C|nr:DUF3267 domain-containing protein [Paenibacillus pinihumi]